MHCKTGMRSGRYLAEQRAVWFLFRKVIFNHRLDSRTGSERLSATPTQSYLVRPQLFNPVCFSALSLYAGNKIYLTFLSDFKPLV